MSGTEASAPSVQASRGPRRGSGLPAALTAVSWSLAGMAAVAALGLHLLGADAVASLGPMTAALVVLAAGGSVTPSGDVDVLGISPAGARGGFDLVPLGVSLVGALLLAWVFLRSLRRAGAVTAGGLAVRVGATTAAFLAVLGGLAWAGRDTIALDGSSLGGGGGEGGPPDGLPDLGDLGDGGGLTDLIGAKASVGFRVDMGASLLGGLVWVLAVQLIALLASRRTPLPVGWEPLHRQVRPAVSALSSAFVLAVGAGAAAGAVAALTGDGPGRIIGGVLLGAPNGVWLAVPLGLFVPWDGSATGQLAGVLPTPLEQLLSGKTGEAITLGRLAELDGLIWLLPVATGLMMLTAGVLAAVRTPVAPGTRAGRLAGAVALRLGLATAVALPLLVWLTSVRVDANLSVFGFDAVGAGLELSGRLGTALPLGAIWGTASGFLGSLLASAAGAAGRRAAAGTRTATGAGAAGVPPAEPTTQKPGPYRPDPAYRPDLTKPEPFNPYRDQSAFPVGGAGTHHGQPNTYNVEFNPYRDGPPPRPSTAPAPRTAPEDTPGEQRSDQDSPPLPDTRWPQDGG